MNTILKLEELGMFILSIYLFYLTDLTWWWFPALILAPDIGMLGYLFGNKAGAISYNLFHHKGIAVAVLIIGYQMEFQWMILAGIILFGHASMDRLFGYGLKLYSGFKFTHLGNLQ